MATTLETLTSIATDSTSQARTKSKFWHNIWRDGIVSALWIVDLWLEHIQKMNEVQVQSSEGGLQLEGMWRLHPGGLQLTDDVRALDLHRSRVLHA